MLRLRMRMNTNPICELPFWLCLSPLGWQHRPHLGPCAQSSCAFLYPTAICLFLDTMSIWICALSMRACYVAWLKISNWPNRTKTHSDCFAYQSNLRRCAELICPNLTIETSPIELLTFLVAAAAAAAACMLVTDLEQACCLSWMMTRKERKEMSLAYVYAAAFDWLLEILISLIHNWFECLLVTAFVRYSLWLICGLRLLTSKLLRKHSPDEFCANAFGCPI